MPAILPFENQIANTALAPEDWPSLLDRMAGMLGCRGAILLSLRETLPVFASPALLPELDGLVGDLEILATDPLVSMNSAMSAPLPDQSSSAVSADDRPIDSQLGLLRFPLRWSDTAIIAFVPKDRFPVSGPVLDGLKTVYPVLQRAIDALARLCMERSLGIMDGRRRPGVASAIIGNRTHLLYMEPNFAAGIEPWFDVDRNHLEARNAELAAHVRSAVEAVCTTGKSDVFRLADAASRVAAALYLTPLHRATAELRPRAGLATLVSASLLDGPDPPTLERVFELTHMEALVAARIINGKTVEDIARDQRRSVLTIRNQLKSVFSKIGCQRQIELLRIVFALVPPTVY